MNQLYKKNEFIVFPIENAFIVCNTKKVFENGNSHLKKLEVCKLIIDLAIERKLPKNPHLVDNIIRISNDNEYIKQLKEFKESMITEKDIEECMKHDSYIRVHGALRQR